MIVIRSGTVYDPANGIDGHVQDLWINGDRISTPPETEEDTRVIDGRGWIIAPGGVEIHTHIAGESLNMARLLSASEASTRGLLVPPSKSIANTYLQLGYTTLMDAAMSPLLSALTQNDLESMENVDRGAYTLVGDHQLIMDAISKDDYQLLEDTLAWLLDVSGGYALKLVNPGIGFSWREGKVIDTLDMPLNENGLTQRKLIVTLATAAVDMGLPHPIHLHANHLGQVGNWEGFCKTLQALGRYPAHICHAQFYCYGKDEQGRICSAAREVVDCISGMPNLTFDVGQVIFGPAMVTTADLQAFEFLKNQKGARWSVKLLEGEGGVCGMPINYSQDNATNAVQWATGLELLLRYPDPERLFMTTDFPNGGPFTAYPRLLSWLMDGDARGRMLDAVHPAAKERTGLADITYEYPLSKVIAMTSWGPAKALGLLDRGHLAPGALADVRCYSKNTNIEEMFSFPSLVIKNGQIVISDGKIIHHNTGRTLVSRPNWNRDNLPIIYKSMSKILSIDPKNYGWHGRIKSRQVEVAA